MIRRGVSLLEVLFSIGVIGIGLLGVIALYPLALGQIGTGMVADRSARAGQNAVEVFSARGMARPDQSLWFKNSATTPATSEDVDASIAEAVLLPDGTNTGFLIDPMFVAVQRQSNGSGYDARLFPYYTRQTIPNPLPGNPPPYPTQFDPRLRRVTLRSSATASTIMAAAQAELLFRSDDDLSFELPLDRNAPPEQIFGANNARRQYEGTISWMATLVPQLDIANLSEPFVDSNSNCEWDPAESYTDLNGNGQYDGVPEPFTDSNGNGIWDPGESYTDSNGNGQYDPAEPFIDRNGNGKWDPAEAFTDSNGNGRYDRGTARGDLYQLSIVVFDRRDSSMAMNAQNERVVNVALFHNGGLGGGDVTLGASTAEELDVKPRQWLMLMATPGPMIPRSAPCPNFPGVSLFRWYRVLDAEEAPRNVPGSVYPWERDVVLQGPDWPVSYFASLTGPAQRPTRAALVSNVVAVYERSIQLER